MKVLFIKLKNIGDALIMTPALTAARELWPDTQIDVLVRKGTEGILKGSLAVNKIYTTAAPEMNRREKGQFLKDLLLIKEMRRTKYDWVFELSDNDRGRLMASMIAAKNRAANIHSKMPFWANPFFTHKSRLNHSNVHRCEKDVELLRQFCGYSAPTPSLQFDQSTADWSFVNQTSIQSPIVIHAVTRWKRKMWPVENWIKLVDRLSQEGPIVLTSGPSQDEVELTQKIASVNPSKVIVTGGKLDWAQMAGLLYSARLLVTLDTATMHLAAACKVPMVAILGPTNEKEWCPWNVNHELVLAPNAPSGAPGDRVVSAVKLEEVWRRCQKILNPAQLALL